MKSFIIIIAIIAFILFNRKGNFELHVCGGHVHLVQNHEAPLPAADLLDHLLARGGPTAPVADHAVGGDDDAGLSLGRQLVLGAAGEHVHPLLLFIFEVSNWVPVGSG